MYSLQSGSYALWCEGLQAYIRVFQPLLLEECAAQLTRGTEQEGANIAQAAVVAQARLVLG